MTFDSIIAKVNEIFIDILDNESIRLSPETIAKDIEEWDSLNHIQLIVAIEKQFKIRFNSSEITKWKNVGEMCDAVLVHVQKAKK